eukprot:7384685-Prymnesium_polylepis.1
MTKRADGLRGQATQSSEKNDLPLFVSPLSDVQAKSSGHACCAAVRRAPRLDTHPLRAADASAASRPFCLLN